MAKNKSGNRIGTDLMSGGPVGNYLASDNAFSDHGLENEEKMNKALQKGRKSK
ncbi:hypothetical protein [Neobacillus notoginsengisoli]|uniref:hypothetical protein n=1 Tax=Neobacillus notoginsengisoli TaxID=1578198 RepID=UPI001314F74D|nr:hypothetical protein [Neobacillus notoginsengisoli]